MSILLGGVGDHPGEREKRPSTLHFRYEHPRTAPLGSDGALLDDAWLVQSLRPVGAPSISVGGERERELEECRRN